MTGTEETPNDHGVPEATAPWLILVVDDEPAIHEVTRMLLGRMRFEDRPAELHHAYSGDEAAAFLRTHPDTALVLLDVVMETDDAGLRLCRRVREKMGRRDLQIVLRTGQPGQAPEQEVMEHYDINGYFVKTELTAQKLRSVVMCALRAWSYIRSLQRHRAARATPPIARAPACPPPLRLPCGPPELRVQPQVWLRDGRLRAMELRPCWHDVEGRPRRGTALLAGAAGRDESMRLGRWLLQQACTLARQLRRATPATLPVSVNLPAPMVHSGQLTETVAEALSAAGLPPTAVAVELDETAAMGDLAASALAFTELRALGVRTLLDRFGTGPASIAPLRRLGPDGLKLAARYVADLGSNADSAAIARSVIALAHTLGMDVIADGVATPRQLEFLKWEGCEAAQGPLVGPEVAPDDAAAMVRELA